MRHYLVVSAAAGVIASVCAISIAEGLPEVYDPDSDALLPVPTHARVTLFGLCVLSPPFFAASNLPDTWVIDYPLALRAIWVGSTIALYVAMAAWLHSMRSSPLPARLGAVSGLWVVVVLALWRTTTGSFWL